MSKSETANALPALTAEEFTVLRRMAGALIGPSKEYGVPGADDEQIASRLLASAGQTHAGIIRSGVHGFAAICAGSGGIGSLADGDFQRILHDFMRQHADFAWRLLMLTTQAYYQDARIIRSLGMEPRPPFPGGHKVEPSDWSLLDPVRARGTVYREVPE
jgi:hypothetical protein